MLNYNKLKLFSVVARHLNMTKAAEELFMGQPALSVHMKELEQELEVTLFIRTNRNLILTDAGQLLFNRVAPFFDDEEKLIRDVKNAALQNNPKVTVGVIGGNITYFLPTIVNKFIDKYNNVEVKMLRLNSDPLNHALMTGDIDIGFQFSGIMEDSIMDNFDYYCVETGRFLAAMPSSCPLAAKKSIRIAELKDYHFTILDHRHSSIAYKDLIRYCRQAGFKPNIISEYSFIEPLLTDVNMGTAITLTSSLAPLKGYDNIRCVDLEDLPPIELLMLWCKNNTSDVTKLFIQHVKQCLDSGRHSI